LDIPNPGGAVSPWTDVRSLGKKPPPIPVSSGAAIPSATSITDAEAEARRQAMAEGYVTTDDLPAETFVGDPVD
jgi:hypothetical protein